MTGDLTATIFYSLVIVGKLVETGISSVTD